MKPRLLDLFCGAGGAAMGYHRAGFEVVGVDIKPQPNYPFEFLCWDALEVLADLIAGASYVVDEAHREFFLPDFAAIHASPPCQRYSTATKRNGTELDHPDLIGPTRELLKGIGLPYVIENVVGAPLRNAVLLCGSTFHLTCDGYRLRRHRMFETNWPLGWFHAGFGCTCSVDRHIPVMDVTGGGPSHSERMDGGGGRPYKGTADQARRIMDIHWMTKAELNEAVPPAYTELIGAQLFAYVQQAAA